MTIVYDRPLGSHADCNEMEYIASLHQTGKKLRKNGSVTAEDVSNLLVSRHGISVSPAYIQKQLMPGLAGGFEDEKSTVFDISELTTLLLIPFLRQQATSDDMEDTFDKIVKIILLDVNGSIDPVNLDRDMMSKILEYYGEDDVAPDVIDQMLNAAGVDPQLGTPLDALTLAKAMTSDIQQFDPEWANADTTHYHDVLDGTTLDDNMEDNDPDEELATSAFDKEENNEEVMRIFTAPQIDFVAENYRSKGFNVLLWVLAIVAFFAYAFETQSSSGQQDCSSKFRSEFGCRIVNAIINWLLIFAELTILGTLFISLSSAGNSIYLQRNIQSLCGVLLGIVTLACASIVSYLFEIEFFLIDTRKYEDPEQQSAYFVVILLGCVLILLQIKGLIYVLFPRWVFTNLLPSFVSNFFLSTGMAKAERCTKQAATFKINRMVDNAFGHHHGSVVQHEASSRLRRTASKVGYSTALLDFQATTNHREPTGGILDTFKKMWNGTLYREEGVWIHARLYAMNIAQIWIALFYMVLYFGLLYWVRDIWDDMDATSPPTSSPAPTVAFNLDEYVSTYVVPVWTEILDGLASNGNDVLNVFWAQMVELRPDLVALLGATLLNGTAVDGTVVEYLIANSDPAVIEDVVRAAGEYIDLSAIAGTTVVINVLEDQMPGGRRLEDVAADDDIFSDLMPSKAEVTFAFTMGGIAAFFVTIALAAIWLPSSVSTIQQFRCGAIGSLHDRAFEKYRAAPDLTTILYGSTFWGTLYASAVLFIIVGVLSFLLVWKFTAGVVLNLIAQLIGIMVTILFKTLLLMFIRKAIFSGFMRKKPAGGNIMLLMFECWSLGLTVGTMGIRMVKLILISAFYIGRLDTPLFAPGVGNIGPAPMDSHPIQFRKDLLVHDTHRHPYMERLAVIYLLKLRYGKDFGNRAGGAWRLIFTSALMPWMRKYRLDDDDDDIDQKFVDESAAKMLDDVSSKEDVAEQPTATVSDALAEC